MQTTTSPSESSSSAEERLLANLLPLMAVTNFYHNFSVAQVVRLFYPPIRLRQCQGLTENGRLVAWCSWAFTTEETKQKFLTGKYKFQPADWSSGDRLIFMDFVAPYGHARQLYRELRESFDHFDEAAWLRGPKGNRRVEVHNER